MANVKVVERVSQLNGCLVIRYQVLITNLIFTLDLADNQLRVTIRLKVMYPISLAIWMPISRALYFAILFEQEPVSKKLHSKTYSSSVINTNHPPAIILPLGHVLDAQSKNIWHGHWSLSWHGALRYRWLLHLIGFLAVLLLVLFSSPSIFILERLSYITALVVCSPFTFEMVVKLFTQ